MFGLFREKPKTQEIPEHRRVGYVAESTKEILAKKRAEKIKNESPAERNIRLRAEYASGVLSLTGDDKRAYEITNTLSKEAEAKIEKRVIKNIPEVAAKPEKTLEQIRKELDDIIFNETQAQRDAKGKDIVTELNEEIDQLKEVSQQRKATEEEIAVAEITPELQKLKDELEKNK